MHYSWKKLGNSFRSAQIVCRFVNRKSSSADIYVVNQDTEEQPSRIEIALNAMLRLSLNRHPRVTSSLINDLVPEVLENLTSFILSQVETEGLFRIGGSTERVRTLYERAEKNHVIPGDQPVQDVCSVLKRWIRKQHLVPKSYTIPASCRCLEDLRPLLTEMSPHKVLILKHLSKFLQITAKNSHANLMNLDNLSSIFGECVFQSEPKAKKPQIKIKDAEMLRSIVEPGKMAMKVLIENADAIDFLCSTPPRTRFRDQHRKSLSTKVKDYGNSIKRSFVVKRSHSAHSVEFRPPPRLFEQEKRIHLRGRVGTLALSSEEIINSRIQALQRKAGAIEKGSQKENTPILRNYPCPSSGDEPLLLNYKHIRTEDSTPNDYRSHRRRYHPQINTPLRVQNLYK